MRKLLIRADASTEIGTGHLMRCLALAQAWHAEGGRVTFLSRCDSPALRRRVRDEGARLVSLTGAHPNPADWQATSRFIGRLKPDWVVLDGYHFDPEYQKAARAAGVRVLVMDDTAHLPEYHADILLNQNLGAEKLYYHCDEDTRLLLGPRYVMLRTEFLKWRERRREIPQEARKVLVTMGGSDPDNVTLEVIHALERVPFKGLEVIVVLGASNPHRESLQAAVKSSKLMLHDHHVRIVRSPTNMPELMAWAELAVAAGGSTCWELAFMGVPCLVIVLAENQRLVAGHLDAAGVSVDLGWWSGLAGGSFARRVSSLLSDTAKLRDMRDKGRRLVDGKGSQRVVSALRYGFLTLRRASTGDCDLLWRWANDAGVRQSAFHSELIPPSEHRRWLDRKLRDPACVILIAADPGGSPVGQIRFDVRGDEATVDVSIDKQRRKAGLGCGLIESGIEELTQTLPIRTVHAYVKPENQPSLHAFAEAGFENCGEETSEGQPSLHLVWKSDGHHQSN
jgi:UDP-2,4-diacetamido-2,4,6-trideoxy-beta-L-altropyranose hydrolase